MNDPFQVENSLILSIRTKSYNFLFLKNQILRYQFASLFWALPIIYPQHFFIFIFTSVVSHLISHSILGLGSHLLVYKQRWQNWGLSHLRRCLWADISNTGHPVYLPRHKLISAEFYSFRAVSVIQEALNQPQVSRKEFWKHWRKEVGSTAGPTSYLKIFSPAGVNSLRLSWRHYGGNERWCTGFFS